MESSRSLRHLLRLLAFAFFSLLRRPVSSRRFFSFVAIREFLIHLSFLRNGLQPVTLDLGEATLHLFAPLHRRQKPALILIHGFGGNSKWQWERQVGTLSRAFDLYIPDLVFFGQSVSDSPDRSVGFQARCMAGAMRRLGIIRYSVAGISYGGFVAFRMAAEEAKGVVERLVILTAAISATEEQRKELTTREEREVVEVLLPQKAEDLMALIQRSMYRHPRWIPAFVLEDFIETVYRNHRKERMEMLNELLENGIDLNPLPVINQIMVTGFLGSYSFGIKFLGNDACYRRHLFMLKSGRMIFKADPARISGGDAWLLRNPRKRHFDTLIVWGEKDNIFPLQFAHQLHRHMAQKSTLEVIEDAGHAVQLEKHEQVNYLIEKFLMGVRDYKLT